MAMIASPISAYNFTRTTSLTCPKRGEAGRSVPLQSLEMVGLRILPTTVLIKNGVEIRHLIGRGDWDGDEGDGVDALLQ